MALPVAQDGAFQGRLEHQAAFFHGGSKRESQPSGGFVG